MDYDARYRSVDDLRQGARRRIPFAADQALQERRRPVLTLRCSDELLCTALGRRGGGLTIAILKRQLQHGATLLSAFAGLPNHSSP